MKYTDFSLYIRPEVQGAPDFLVERAVRDSAIDFCQRTDIYIAEPEYIAISANVNEYSVSIPTATELNHIIDVYNDKTPLKPVSYTDLLRRLGDEDETGTPRYYSQRDNDVFFVAPVPDAAESFRVMFTLKPTSTSSSLTDAVAKENREIITHGALYRLQMMNGQVWTSLAMAEANRGLYEKAVGRMVRQAKYGSGGSLTAVNREFI